MRQVLLDSVVCFWTAREPEGERCRAYNQEEAEADQRCCKFQKRSGDHREPPEAERLKEAHLDN